VAGAAARSHVARRQHGHAGEQPQRHPVLLALLGEPLLPALGVPADVGDHREALGADLAGQPHRLGHRVAGADHQVAAPAAERFAQVGQGLMQKADPVGGDRLQRGVEHEQRDHPLGVGAGGGERRVVVEAQVPGEQHDRGLHAGVRIGVPGRVSRERRATEARRLFGTVARRVNTS
jgi:hypothetical protein